MATKQANALAAITDFKNAAQSFNNLYWLCKQLAERQSNNDYVGTWNVQPTYAINADGSQGATDGTPNTAHPMVGQDVSAGALSTVDGYLINDFINFMENGVVNSADRRPAVGGVMP